MSVVPGQTTLSAVRLLAQQRADMVGSNFLDVAEWNANISLSLYELYDLLIQKFGDNYFVAVPYTFQTDGTNSQYSLPSDFYKLLGVDLSLSANTFVSLKPFNFAERNQNSVANVPLPVAYANLRYRLNGNKLWFMPLPAAGQTIQLWYAPRLAALVNDSDIIDGVSGWEEYVIVDAAIKAKAKEESDVSVLLAQKAALIRRIESAAENRDAGSPATVSDVYPMSGWDY